MPALTMRGRYLMREYWSDSDLWLRLSADERECYQGLWMIADDHGWAPRDIPAIAAAIYHYVDRAPREAWVRWVLDRLRELGKVESYRCCIHLPAVERYPRPGRKAHEHYDEHQKHSKRNKGNQSVSPLPDHTSPDPSIPNLAGAGAQEAPGPQTFGEFMAAHGFEVKSAGKQRTAA